MSDNLVRLLAEHEAEHVFGGTSHLPTRDVDGGLCDDPLISCDDEENPNLPKVEIREDPLP